MLFRHAKERRDGSALRYEGWQVGISVCLFWVLASVVPLYNKIVFAGIAGDKGFPYPITTAFLQLGFCAVSLTLYDIVRRIIYLCTRVQPSSGYDVVLDETESDKVSSQETNSNQENGNTTSWIFGDHLWFKVKFTLPIGVLFGLKYGVTNWGLHLLPLAPHLLLQATDLMWTVLFAHLFTRELLSRQEFLTCVGSTAGTILIAWRTHQTLPDSFYSILVNLTSPVLLGLCITFLRKAAHSLLVKENRVDGRCQGMTPFELTGIKLWISSLTIFPFAFLFENNGAYYLFGWNLPNPEVTAYQAALHETPALGLAALGGGIFVLCFQVNMTWLSKMTTAVTVGMVGGMKILPQWLTAIAFSQSVDLNILNMMGAFILLLSSLVWTYLRHEQGSIVESASWKYVTRTARRRSNSCRGAQPRKWSGQSGSASRLSTSTCPTDYGTVPAIVPTRVIVRENI